MARRLPSHLLVPAALIALLGVLAALQYRWLGQVSEAERDRMRQTLSARANALAEDVDREITRLFLLFQIREPKDGPDLARALEARHGAWTKTSRYPDMLEDVYVVASEASNLLLRRLVNGSGGFESIPWPDDLEAVRKGGMVGPLRPGGTFALRLPAFVLNQPLAVIVPLALVEQRMVGRTFETRLLPGHGYVLLRLNERYVRTELLPALVRHHFSSDLSEAGAAMVEPQFARRELPTDLSEYRVSVVDPRRPDEPVYASDASGLQPSEADVSAGLLALRFGLAERLITPELRTSLGITTQGLVATRPPPPAEGRGGSRQASERVTIFLEQRAEPPDGSATAAMRTALPGASWQLLIKHRAGSLEAAVARVRARNLALSFGVLALLAVSVGLVFVSARRAERLAARQMEFVATVSHELRTPLAVIRSAGQNLAAGVVHDPDQTRRYGELIDGEGRRLSDMVEQTLALAGLSGARAPLARQLVDPGGIVRSVLTSPETPSRDAGMVIELRIDPDLPPVLADEMLLRRAVQNLIGNALKYGRGGGWLGVVVEGGRGRRSRDVSITVSDRGPGIEPQDLPHIFDAFYRGRRPLADQVQGNGLGLNLVKRIADAHGGRVTVHSEPGRGASFTLYLPAHAEASPQPVRDEQPQHS